MHKFYKENIEILTYFTEEKKAYLKYIFLFIFNYIVHNILRKSFAI